MLPARTLCFLFAVSSPHSCSRRRRWITVSAHKCIGSGAVHPGAPALGLHVGSPALSLRAVSFPALCSSMKEIPDHGEQLCLPWRGGSACPRHGCPGWSDPAGSWNSQDGSRIYCCMAVWDVAQVPGVLHHVLISLGAAGVTLLPFPY